MKILFDQGTPVPLRAFLPGHVVITAYERGWAELTNGALLRAAESESFGCFVTTDQNLRYQQKLEGRTIGIVVLLSTSWPKMLPKAATIAGLIESVDRGGYLEIPV